MVKRNGQRSPSIGPSIVLSNDNGSVQDSKVLDHLAASFGTRKQDMHGLELVNSEKQSDASMRYQPGFKNLSSPYKANGGTQATTPPTFFTSQSQSNGANYDAVCLLNS